MTDIILLNLPKSAHPHNDVDPVPTTDPDLVKQIKSDIDDLTDDEVEEVYNHARYVRAMRERG